MLVVANWKSHNPEISNFIRQLADQIPNNLEIAIAPPFPYLSNIPGQFSRCAQDVSQFASGPYTGEVSAETLKSLGVKYCLVGHSERRRLLGEMTTIVSRKVDQLISVGIIPIICAQNLEDIPNETLRLSANRRIAQGDLAVMYEPEEAISTNGQYRPESPENINQVIQDWQSKLPPGTRFVYGGSVNPENISLLIARCSLVSGVVVGHASLDANEFSRIIEGCLSTAYSSS